jgi:hypothetical protein
VQELRDHEVREVVVDRLSDEHDAVVEEPRVDVEGALATRGLLQDHRDERAVGTADLHVGSPVRLFAILQPFGC